MPRSCGQVLHLGLLLLIFLFKMGQGWESNVLGEAGDLIGDPA